MDIIEKHQKAAQHFEEAAKNHYEAARYYEAGDHNKAYHSTLKAFGHCTLAGDAQKENLNEYEAMK